MPLSIAYRRAAVDHFFRGVPQSSPDAIYVGLFTTMPTQEAAEVDMVEVLAMNGYARQSVVLDDPDTLGRSRITSDLAFPASINPWGLVLGFGLFDAVTSGNLLAYQSLVTPRFIARGVVAWWQANNLVVQMV